MVKRGIFRQRSEQQSHRLHVSATGFLLRATYAGIILGLLVAVSIAVNGGNQINVNGTLITGFLAWAIVVFVCAIAGLAFGVIGWFLLRALSEASK